MYHTDIVYWHEHVRIRRLAHRIAAEKYDRYYSIVGFAAILATLVAGYEVAHKNFPQYAIFIGVVAIIAALLNATLKFFGFENKKQRHHSAAIQYASLQYEMERWLMLPEKTIPEEFYEKIASQLSEIEKNAPLLSTKKIEKAKHKVQENNVIEFPIRYKYDVNISEIGTIQGNDYSKILGDPVRTYICKSLVLDEYQTSKKVSINIELTMTRENQDYLNVISGDGIIDNNVCFIQYEIRNFDNENTTYGTMVISFINRVQAEGYWMTSGVKGANFLIGKIEMNLQKNTLQNSSTMHNNEMEPNKNI